MADLAARFSRDVFGQRHASGRCSSGHAGFRLPCARQVFMRALGTRRGEESMPNSRVTRLLLLLVSAALLSASTACTGGAIAGCAAGTLAGVAVAGIAAAASSGSSNVDVAPVVLGGAALGLASGCTGAFVGDAIGRHNEASRHRRAEIKRRRGYVHASSALPTAKAEPQLSTTPAMDSAPALADPPAAKGPPIFMSTPPPGGITNPEMEPSAPPRLGAPAPLE